MRWAERRRGFRALLRGDRCIHPASVYDPISARIAGQFDFELLMLPGSSAALSALGMPDLTLLTLTEFAEQARRISRVTRLPLLVDADHGYGNALNVQRTIEELEMSGAAAATIEDTQLPAPFGTRDAVLVPLAEGIGKMAAAVAARTDPEFAIIARTSALMTSGDADVITRLTAYEKTGVDALFLAGLRSLDQLDAVVGATSLPLIVGGSLTATVPADELARRRVRICLRGHQPLEAAVEALHRTFSALSGRSPDDEAPTARVIIAEVSGANDYAERARAYLGA